MPGSRNDGRQNPVSCSTLSSSGHPDVRVINASKTPSTRTDLQDDGMSPYPSVINVVGSSRNSPDPAATLGNGQYIDHTSALSFLHRAYSKSKTGDAHDVSHADRSNQPLTAAGDKPLTGSSAAGLTFSPTILPPIPEATDAKDLLDLYFEVCVATYKPLHRGTIDTWYRVVVCNIEQGLPITNSLGNARVAVLLGVFAISTLHRQKSRGFSEDLPSLSQSDAFFKVASNLIETETGDPQLESAQARLVQVFYLLGTCRMNQAWYIFGSLLQIIAALGMVGSDNHNPFEI